MNINKLRQEISEYLAFAVGDTPLPLTMDEVVPEQGYSRARISYPGDDGGAIPAYLLLPPGRGHFPAVLVHHQHHSQRHFGKSEVCGLAGDPLQAFGPALARQGMVVLAPDSICFEDRRRRAGGTEPDEDDTMQHFREMCYRLVRGDTLMRKVLDDSARGISVLLSHPQVAAGRVGMLGHSYGGQTTLFHAALDQRIRFACASGAAGSYRYKLAHDIGIEMAAVIPGFAAHFDMHDLVSCLAPRPALIVSATDDFASKDADLIVAEARKAYAAAGREANLEHTRYEGGHALTEERFHHIITWITRQSQTLWRH